MSSTDFPEGAITVIPGIEVATTEFVSPGEISRYFAAKKISEVCARCGRDEWLLYENEITRGGVIGCVVSPGVLSPTLHFPVLVLSCTNCGEIWQMSRAHVQRWLKENPVERE